MISRGNEILILSD